MGRPKKIHSQESIKRNFASLIEPVPESGCWLWTGQVFSKTGYAKWRPSWTNEQYAHRIAYIIFVGVIPDDKYVLHRCNVKSCVNPSHLYLGTQFDNMRDAKVAGVIRLGEERKFAKLTDGAVREIKASPSLGLQYFADKFEVSRAAIRQVLIGKSWKHVT